MSSIKVKIIGYSIILTMLSLVLIMITCLTMEFSGLSRTIFVSKFMDGGANLINFSYYKNKHEKDPYAKFSVQHLHPYYLFFFLWTLEQQSKTKSEVVTLGSDGFRKNPALNDQKVNTVLMGGSTAFGHFSSNDENTFAHTLTKTTTLNIYNLNAPSWTTHQELVALAKYSGPYELSISLSVANDIGTVCGESFLWINDEKYLDAPLSFVKLSKQLNVKSNNFHLDVGRIVKDAIRRAFPDTYLLLYTVKNNFRSSQNVWHSSSCSGINADKIAESFLRNQKAMLSLSLGRGATHLVILQPHLDLIDTNRPNFKFSRQVYDKIMKSEFCNTNLCLDLSATHPELTRETLFDGTNLQTAWFADPGHLTDKGVSQYTLDIKKFLKDNSLIYLSD